MWLLDLIYPKRCVGCGGEGMYICDKCGEGVRVRDNSLRYEGVVRKSLKEIKYRGSYDMVRELVTLWQEKVGVQMQERVVTAVPMWQGKRRRRGFNQAELFAREMAKGWGLAYRELFVRTRETRPMYGLSREERQKNVEGAFRVLPNLTRETMPKRIVLVDDVWTTGATMRECAKAWRNQGGGGIELVTLSR